jgi:hypothetical protein
MPGGADPTADPRQATTYEIRVEGHLDPAWGDWFLGLAVTPEENGDTLLTGPVVDQAALHGLLRKVRDLGVPLISINRLEPGRTSRSEEDEGEGA